MIINTFLESIKTALKEVVDIGVEVELHGGRFSQKELERLMTLTPCALIAPLKINEADSAEEIDDEGNVAEENASYEMNMGVYIITNSLSLDAFGEQIDLTEKVSKALINKWFAHAIEPTEKFAARNLYTGSLDEISCAMWLATFNATIDERAPAVHQEESEDELEMLND